MSGNLSRDKKKAVRVGKRRDGTMNGGWARAIIRRLGSQGRLNDGKSRRVRMAVNDLRPGERECAKQEQGERETQPRTTLRTRGSLHCLPVSLRNRTRANRRFARASSITPNDLDCQEPPRRGGLTCTPSTGTSTGRDRGDARRVAMTDELSLEPYRDDAAADS